MAFRRRLTDLLVRFTVYCLVAGILWGVPEPPSESILRYKNSCVAFLFIVALGKLLYDTLFYDRYHG